MSLSKAAQLLLAAFPGSTPDPDPAMWAGIEGDLPDGYVAQLPPGTAEAIEMAARQNGWVWGVCTVCGTGSLVKPPPTPQKEREIGDSDGPVCGYTRYLQGQWEKCKGRRYPMDGPIQHPLMAERPTRPW